MSRSVLSLAALRAAVLWLALAAPATQAATVQLSFAGRVGEPTNGFVPDVAVGTSIRYEVQFEDRFSDGDFSDWADPLGPVTGWAAIGSDLYELDGDRWRVRFESPAETKVSVAFTGSGPLTASGDLFEGVFVSFSSVTGWAGDGGLGYRRLLPSGSASFGYRDLDGTTTVTPVPEANTLLLSLAGLSMVCWVTWRRRVAA